MPEVLLNPQLYGRLKQVFGDVRVHNQGEPMRVEPARRAFMTPGRRRDYVRLESPGEYYAVCCPVCGDTRHRLWVNHRWNTGFGNHSMKHLVRCYNENCDELEDFRSTLEDLLDPSSLISVIQHVDPQTTAPEVIDYPGEVVRLSELGDHGVVRYLRDTRGFDIGVLEDDWGLRWVVDAKPEHKLVFDANRLVVPIYDGLPGDVKMVGWQTRYFNYHTGSPVPPSKRTPKYITNGRPSTVLYNFWRARSSDLLVVCEGVFDAIRVGTQHGVCTFGKTMSDRQADLIENGFLTRGGRVVFAYDPDVSDKSWKRVVKRVEKWPDVRYLSFPGTSDVADYDQQAINTLVAELKESR